MGVGPPPGGLNGGSSSLAGGFAHAGRNDEETDPPRGSPAFDPISARRPLRASAANLRRFPAGLDKNGLCHHFAHPASPDAAFPSGFSTMPKMKTKKAAAKRFRVTGSGRVRRSKAGGNHGMQEKSRKRLRRLRQNDMGDKSMQKRARRLLPHGCALL